MLSTQTGIQNYNFCPCYYMVYAFPGDKLLKLNLYTCLYFIQNRSSDESAHYKPTKTGEAYLFVDKSTVVGVGGVDTGLGLYTYKTIPKNVFVCAYAPTATLKTSQQDGDYALELTIAGECISVNGQENAFEIGLGIFCNDGSFPFSLLPEKFSRLVSHRVNCEFVKRDNEVWIKSSREIQPKEELLVCYSSDGSYWKSVFSPNQLQMIKEALRQCGPSLREAENAVSILTV